jgi:peptide deformylase
MFEDLKIILWPDPRLKKVSKEVAVFDDALKALADRMFQLMREHRGVGLAAPQVGINKRLFVMNATGKPEDDAVYVNPVLHDAEGEDEAEEGCLSLPQINIQVWRSKKMRIDAQDLTGQKFSQTADGYLTRIWQHEFDHLNGVMLTDRMGPVAKLSNRRILKDLEEKYASEHVEPVDDAKKELKKKRRKRES